MAQTVNMVIDQGSTYTHILDVEQLIYDDRPFDTITNPWIPFSLTGYSAYQHIRKSVDDSKILIQNTSANGAIQLGANGRLTITFSADSTSALTIPQKGQIILYHDVFLVNGSYKKKIAVGNVTVKKAVTRNY